MLGVLPMSRAILRFRSGMPTSLQGTAAESNAATRTAQRSDYSAGGALLQQVFRVFGGNSKVRASKILEYGEIYADHFSVAVEERSA